MGSMEDLKFSIVVPTYGVANYITESLGALMHQNYDNFEVIVVDDCSPDRSGEIAKSFVERDDRFIYVRHEENKGVSEARNTGIDHATGDYILFLDPDDTYEIHMLSVLAKTLMRNPVDLLIFSYTEDYRNAKTGKQEYSKQIKLKDLDYEDGVFTTNDPVSIHKLAIQMEHITMLGYPWNKAYKASVIKENNLRYQKIRHIEDILFNCDFLECTKTMTVVADILYHYRNQGQSRLTGGQIDDYFVLQKKRIQRIWEQQQAWRTCDFEALGILSGEYFRSFQSNIVRMLEAGIDEEEILRWCKFEEATDMYEEMRKYLPSDDKKLYFTYEPLVKGMFGSAIKRARIMQYTKEHAGGLFNVLKQIR